MSSGENRQSRAVLSEEEYTATLNEIVQREYFPDLPALRRQVAVLDRRAIGDVAGAVAIRRAARQLEEHERSLAEQEQEEERNVDDASYTRKVPRPLHRETVTGFHARVTSEDNAEFEQTQRQEVQANRERLQHVFSLRITNVAEHRVGSETPLLASDKFNPSPHRIAASEWKNNEVGTNGLFFTPQHAAVGEASEQKLLTNASEADSADNQLMPPPARVRRTQGSSSDTSSTLVLKQNMVEFIPKHQVEKRIDPSQTRFPAVVALRPQRPTSDAFSTDYSTEASTDLDSPMLSISTERVARAKRQKREHEAFVNMTPQIMPGRSAAGNESPIVTWGTVSATPMVLRGVDEMQFSLPAESGRDHAARRAEAALEKKRRKTRQRSSISPATPLDRMTASLTPAALSLINKSTMKRSSSVRSGDAFSSALRSSYTPKRTTSLKRDSVGKATPRVSSKSKRTGDTMASNGNITDGLLKIK